MPRQALLPPTSPVDDVDPEPAARPLDAALDEAGLDAVLSESYIAAADVIALLNRVGDCVRALPSFGRTRTSAPAVVAKRTLSAISTCNLEKLEPDDPLRPVLARVAATRRRVDRP